MSVLELKAPDRIIYSYKDIHIFLAGSIEMGTAELWQDKVIKEFTERESLYNSSINFIFDNPRRDDWDSSWEQTIENPQFFEQVTWELDMINRADVVFFYFDPNTKSPITLMELGLISAYNSANSIVLCCPEGYWRRGNIEVLAHRNKIELHSTLQEGLNTLESLVLPKLT